MRSAKCKITASRAPLIVTFTITCNPSTTRLITTDAIRIHIPTNPNSKQAIAGDNNGKN